MKEALARLLNLQLSAQAKYLLVGDSKPPRKTHVLDLAMVKFLKVR